MGHLANDFCRSCSEEKEEEIVTHLLGTYRAIRQRRKRRLGAYYIDDQSDLLKIDFGSLSRFIVSFRWF